MLTFIKKSRDNYCLRPLFLCDLHICSEYITEKKSKEEVLVFRRGATEFNAPNKKGDIEAGVITPATL